MAEAVAKAAPAVVNIDTTITTRVYNSGGFGFIDPFDFKVQEIPRGMGTGVIVSDKGIVLTNNHVVSGARTIRVTLSNKSQYKAKILGTDPVSDLAILQIENPQKETFPTATLTNSEKMRIGDWVVALGNPLGVGQTATLGILSARNRSLSDSNVDLRNLLQTDAAINGGNSGGPLVNAAGEAIGINTAVSADGDNVGFAIPITSVKGMVKQLLETGEAERSYLGLTYITLTPTVAETYNLPVETGAYVNSGSNGGSAILEGGPADQAGIQDGDIITEVNGVKVGAAGSVTTLIGAYAPGDTIQIKILRDDHEKNLNVTLGAYEG